MVFRRFGPVSIMISLGYYAASSFLFLSSPSLSILCHVRYVYAIMYFFVFLSCFDDLLHVHFQFIPYLHAVHLFLSFPFPSFSYFIYFVHTIFSWSLDKSFILSVLFICCILYSKLR